jgi:hypothetical protein
VPTLYLVVEEIGHVSDIAGGFTFAAALKTPLDWSHSGRAGGPACRLFRPLNDW